MPVPLLLLLLSGPGPGLLCDQECHESLQQRAASMVVVVESLAILQVRELGTDCGFGR